MKTKSLLVLGIIVIMHLSVKAQVKIGNNPTAINSNSLLELESTNQGFVLPRVSIGDVSAYSPMLSNPLTGTIVYNTNTGTTGGSGTGIYLWDGTKWVFISTGSAVSSSAWLLTGNSGLNSSSNFIGTTDAIDFVLRTANTERMRILGAVNGSSKAGWIGMGVTVPRSSLDVTGHYTNKNVITIENSSTSGYSSVDMLDSAGNLKSTFGYANTGAAGLFAGRNYFNNYGTDFLFTANSSNNDFYMKGSTGYIGLNTNAPSERLHVVGNIYLNGAFMPGGTAGTTGYVLTSAGAGVSPTWNNLNNLSWSLTGNSGTSYATNFLGTTDNVSMRFRTNNVQRMIIDSLGKVGIGISNPSYALSVLSASNPLYLSGIQATSTLTADSVLTINNGVVKKTSSASLTGISWLLAGNTGTNSAINFLGTTDNHPLKFRVNNTIAGYIDSSGGLGNSYFGSNAGYSITTGSGNTFVGAGADSANNTGASNTALGYQTGYNNTSGGSNTFTGYQNGFSNTTGSGNLFSGFQAGYRNTTGQVNVFSGYWTGYSNTTGSNNGFLGYLSGFGNTTGNNNVFIGSQTGSANTTGSNNTLIGSNANVLSAALTNAAAMGYNAKVAVSNSLVLGDTATGNAVNVGIGVRNPLKRLHIDAAPITSASSKDSLKIDNLATSSSVYRKAILVIDSSTGYVSKQSLANLTSNLNWSLTGNSGTNYATNFLGTTDNVSLRLRTNNTERMIIDSLGSVGIGSSNFDPINKERLLVDYGATASNTIASFTGSTDNYFQINLQNKSATGNASTDYVATADDGTDSTYYVDMGINSSNYSFSIDNWGQAHDAYLYSNSKNLLMGTQAPGSDVIFLVGGGRAVTNAALRIRGNTGNIVVGKGDVSATPVGNVLRGPNGLGTNISGGNLAVQAGAGTGTGAGGNLLLGGGITGTGGANGVISFSTSGAERMRIDSGGNVGIGTTNPAYKLSVLAASNPLYLSGVQATSTFNIDSILTINAGVVKKAAYSSLAAAGNWSLTGNAGTNYATNFLGTTDNVSMRIRTNNIQRMIIDSLGKVGIGTSSPASDLTIYQSSGSGNSKGFTFTGNSIGGTNSGTGFLMSLGYNTTGNKQLWLGDADYAGNVTGSFARFVVGGTSFPVIDAVSGDNALRRYIAFGVTGDANSGVIFGGDNTAVNPGSQVWDNGNMTIGSGYKSYAAPANGLLVQGNVGIGIANPSNALSVLAASNPLYLSGVQATSTFTTDSILTINAGVVKKTPYSSLPTVSGAWALNGNSITAGQFLGTTNAQALVLKANNVQMGYFDGNISSLALGVGAVNNTSDHNVAIGYNANTNNQYALALGYNAAATGVRSVAIGNGAAATTASGSEAVAIGYNATTVGNQSVSIGYQATGSGQYGVALGYNAQATALQSTAIGYQAQATQQYANAIGYQAQATGLQSTAIGYQAQTAQSNTILLGNAATGNLYVGIGTATPTAKLHIVGGTTTNYPLQMTGLPTGAVGIDNLLTINSSGVVGYITPAIIGSTYWSLNGNAAFSGSFLGTTNTTPLQFKFNSTNAGYLDASNTALGTSSVSTAGTNNTAIGNSANAANGSTAIGASSVTTAANNTAVGNSATANNSTNETALGASAQATAQYNTAVGYNAQAISNSQATAIGTTAKANAISATALGYNAQAISNGQTTALGTNSLANAQYATAVGYNAQSINNSYGTALGTNSNTTGQYATAIGSETDATSQYSTALGYNAQATTNNQTTAIGANTSATGSNSTALGYSATTAQNNAIVLGTGTNNVGIGTSTPNTNTRLDVAGSFKLGSVGTVEKNVVSASGSVNTSVPPQFNAVTLLGISLIQLNTSTSYSDVTITLPNTLTSTQASVMVSPSFDLPTGVIIAFARVISTTQVKVRFINNNTTAQTVSGNLYVTVTEF